MTGTASFADSHQTGVAAFQRGEAVFVWARVKGTDELWRLDDDTAVEHRAFVKEHLACPVPGCNSKLTTAHRTKKRDGLQHLSGKGGHSRESIFHSQGCALIESWLSEAYPDSSAVREEYTNEAGERRADVLLTGPTGKKMAFEVQYSPLTPDAWQRRHDSYRDQQIVDVWLFGHTGKQLKFNADGLVKLNPTHEAVLDSGSAVFFLNPELELLGVSVGKDYRYDIEQETPWGTVVAVWDAHARSGLELRPLRENMPSMDHGLTSGWLSALYKQTVELRAHNAAAPAQVVANRERREREKVAQQQRWEGRRAPVQTRILDAFAASEEPWGRSEAHALIRSYFSSYLRGRIDADQDGSLSRWQCVLYFEFIAGHTEPFAVSDAFNRIVRRGLGMDPSSAFKDIARYLYALAEDGYLSRAPVSGKYPRFVATVSGAWW